MRLNKPILQFCPQNSSQDNGYASVNVKFDRKKRVKITDTQKGEPKKLNDFDVIAENQENSMLNRKRYGKISLNNVY